MNQNTIDRLSSSDSNKIASVVEDAFRESLAGGNPSEALAKAASAAKLTIDQTKRASEAFNVTRTLHHYHNSNGHEKAGSFPISNPDDVIKIMYFDKLPEVKEVSVEKEAFSGGEYDLGTYSDGIDQDLPSVNVPTDVTFDTLYRKISKSAKAAEAVRYEMSETYNNLLVTIETNLHKMASLTNGIYGDSVNSIEDEVIRGAVSQLVTKAAAVRDAVEPTNDLTRLIAETNALMKQAAALEVATDNVKETLEDFSKAAASSLEKYQRLGPSSFRPLMGASLSDPITSSFVNRMVSKNMGTVLDNFSYNPYNDPQFRDVVQTREVLKNAVTLSRLIKDDPVLSKADPKQVTDAYNSMFATMPSYFANPELARAGLRYHVEYGGMDFPTMLTAVTQHQNKMTDPNREINRMAEEYSAKSKENRNAFTESIVSGRETALKARQDRAKAVADKRERQYARDKDKAEALQMSLKKLKETEAANRSVQHYYQLAAKYRVSGDITNPGFQKALDALMVADMKAQHAQHAKGQKPTGTDDAPTDYDTPDEPSVGPAPGMFHPAPGPDPVNYTDADPGFEADHVVEYPEFDPQEPKHGHPFTSPMPTAESSNTEIDDAGMAEAFQRATEATGRADSEQDHTPTDAPNEPQTVESEEEHKKTTKTTRSKRDDKAQGKIDRLERQSSSNARRKGVLKNLSDLELDLEE